MDGWTEGGQDGQMISGATLMSEPSAWTSRKEPQLLLQLGGRLLSDFTWLRGESGMVRRVTPAVTCQLRSGRRRPLGSVNIYAKHALCCASAEKPDCQTSGCWQQAHYLCCA